MISLNGKVVLAPMAGITDRAFREVCMDYGADMCFTEMVSTKGLYYNDKKTRTLLEVSEKEQPVFAQLFGHEPQIYTSVVREAASFGACGIDINCGCPAKKIITNHDGGYMMKSPKTIYDVVRAVKESTDLPVSVKIRLGWDDDSKNAVEVARLAEKAGVSHITVHGRTVSQAYTGKADIDGIYKVVQSVSVPVIANGDITTPVLAQEMFEKTGCAAIMIGRGALGNPFIFGAVRSYLDGGELLDAPTYEERINTALVHIKKIVLYKGESVGIKEARKHALWYVKGMKNSVRVKQLLTSATSYEEMETLLTSLI